MNKKYIVCFLCLYFVVLIVGCDRNALGTVKASGTVLMDGQPAEDISVFFVPTTEGRDTAGMTDTNGKFVLTATAAPVGSGAIPGEYIPTFARRKVAGWDLSEEEARAKFGTGPRATIDLIPKKYSDTKTCGFEPVRIEKGKKNVFHFELQSK